MAAKEVDVCLSVGFGQGGGNRYWSIKVKDRASGCLIADIKVQPEDFFDLMSSTAETSGTAKIYDSFALCGLKRESKVFLLTDDRLIAAGYENLDAIFREVVDSARSVTDDGGWTLAAPTRSGLYQGQFDSTAGTLKVTAIRFVEVPT